MRTLALLGIVFLAPGRVSSSGLPGLQPESADRGEVGSLAGLRAAPVERTRSESIAHEVAHAATWTANAIKVAKSDIQTEEKIEHVAAVGNAELLKTDAEYGLKLHGELVALRKANALPPKQRPKVARLPCLSLCTLRRRIEALATQQHPPSAAPTRCLLSHRTHHCPCRERV